MEGLERDPQGSRRVFFSIRSVFDASRRSSVSASPDSRDSPQDLPCRSRRRFAEQRSRPCFGRMRVGVVGRRSCLSLPRACAMTSAVGSTTCMLVVPLLRLTLMRPRMVSLTVRDKDCACDSWEMDQMDASTRVSADARETRTSLPFFMSCRKGTSTATAPRHDVEALGPCR